MRAIMRAFLVNMGESEGWLDPTPNSGVIPAGVTANVTVTVDANGLDAGGYTSALEFTTNAPALPSVIFPVSLTVLSAEFSVDPEEVDVSTVSGIVPSPLSVQVESAESAPVSRAAKSGELNPFQPR